MAIANVELTNTFNEFRTTVNEALTQINSYTSGAGTIDLNTINAENITATSSIQGATVLVDNLNLGRVVVAGASGQLVDDSGLTYNTDTNALTVAGAISSTSLTASGLTSGRVALVGSGGLLLDDSGIRFDTSTDALTVGGAITASGDVTGANAEFDVLTANVLSLSGALSVDITGNVDATTVTASSLTSGRVVLAGTSGVLQDDSGLTFDTGTDSLTVAGAVDVGTDLSVTGNTTLSTNLDVTGTLDVGGIATFSSNVEISGNLIITGETLTINVESKVIEDPLIYLASNNYFSDLVDIGFVGNYNNGVNNEHTGVVRHAGDGKMYFFTGYEPEPTNNIINVSHASFEPASIVAGNAELNLVTANSLTINNYTLPTSDGSANQILITDGSGNVSFGEVPSGGPSGITTGKAIAMAIVFG